MISYVYKLLGFEPMTTWSNHDQLMSSRIDQPELVSQQLLLALFAKSIQTSCRQELRRIDGVLVYNAVWVW
jgi:hypothetical protein